MFEFLRTFIAVKHKPHFLYSTWPALIKDFDQMLTKKTNALPWKKCWKKFGESHGQNISKSSMKIATKSVNCLQSLNCRFFSLTWIPRVCDLHIGRQPELQNLWHFDYALRMVELTCVGERGMSVAFVVVLTWLWTCRFHHKALSVWDLHSCTWWKRQST